MSVRVERARPPMRASAARAETAAAEVGPRPKLKPRAALLAVLLTLAAVFAVAPARAYLEQRARINELERRAQILARANADLEAEVRGLRDPVEIERLARECLGMVRPGEISFVTVPKGGDPRPADC